MMRLSLSSYVMQLLHHLIIQAFYHLPNSSRIFSQYYSMRNPLHRLPTIFFLLILSTALLAQDYNWHKGFGSTLDDEVFDITHDAQGNIYTTGIFEGTADLDPGPGTQNFTAVGAGDVFFAKYDSIGDLMWVKTIGSVDDEEGQGIRLDAQGNIYLTGLFSDVADFDPGAGTANLTSLGTFDIYIAKYDNAGNYIWAHSIGSTNNAEDYPSKMDIDANANIYITGQFGGTADFDPGSGTANLSSTGGWDIFFAKYDSNGNYVWARSIDNTTNADDFGYNIAVDASANVYVTGQYDGTCDFDPGSGTANQTSVGGWDIFFAKYDSGGNYLWAQSIGGSSDDAGNCITIDAQNNVYVTGYFMSTVDFDNGPGVANLSTAGVADMFYGKFDNNGNYIWVNKVGGSGDDMGNWISVNALGEIFITGQFSTTADFDPGSATSNLTSAGSWDIFLAKYDNSGNFVWAGRMGGAGVDQSHVLDIVAYGRMLIAGEVPNTCDFDPGSGTANYSSTGLDDAFFAEYSDAGTGIATFATQNVLSCHPNPASEGFTIRFSVKQSQIVRWTMINMLGEVVLESDSEAANQGENTVSINTADLADGVYFMNLYASEGGFTQRIVISR